LSTASDVSKKINPVVGGHDRGALADGRKHRIPGGRIEERLQAGVGTLGRLDRGLDLGLQILPGRLPGQNRQIAESRQERDPPSPEGEKLRFRRDRKSRLVFQCSLEQATLPPDRRR
jgi:hypothetical protein